MSSQIASHSLDLSRINILVVGAGGIGCELLKNLVLSGFKHISVIDLDTIEVSNLNRQFLFRRQHVGMSKAQVAAESVVKFDATCSVTPYHESVTNSHFNIDFYKKFDVVMNALDNRVARSHVNMMCMDADIPLIETGTAGYQGQVQVIKKGRFECYDCIAKGPDRKTYPGCTIRNTPSEPIHCIVWAKHLFNQLFGLADEDENVSPDTADPEAVGSAGVQALTSEASLERVSTRSWAAENSYDAKKLFNKFFVDDIKYLLSMDTLWEKRKAPKPLQWPTTSQVSGNGSVDPELQQLLNMATHSLGQDVWKVEKCVKIFCHALEMLKHVMDKSTNGHLVWDKDDDTCMDFVAAVATLRCNIFHIKAKSRFEVKSMAGNIIPAIATTNAMIASLAVVEATKIIDSKFDKCRNTYLRQEANYRGSLWAPCQPEEPNKECVICGDKLMVRLKCNLTTFQVDYLNKKVLQGNMDMREPDVLIHGTSQILVSSEDEASDSTGQKTLASFNLESHMMLECDDFARPYHFQITLENDENMGGNVYQLLGDVEKIKSSAKEGGEELEESKEEEVTREDEEDEDACVIIDELVSMNGGGEDDGTNSIKGKKRKHDDIGNEVINGISPEKKKKQVITDIEVVDID